MFRHACSYVPFINPAPPKQEEFQVLRRRFYKSLTFDVSTPQNSPIKNQSQHEGLTEFSSEALVCNENRFVLWRDALRKACKISKPETVTDQEIYDVVMDLPNQNIVKCDCKRMKTSGIDKSLKDDLKKLLTFYCKMNNITYLQGMNEVAGPFIHFRTLGVKISDIYECFSLFIERYMPSIFIDQHLLGVHCYFRILKLLIKFHEPKLYIFFRENYLPPGIYATPWFITHFSNKLDLEMAYVFWDLFILEDDPNLIFFIALALLSHRRDAILKCDPTSVPERLCNITIQSISQMATIYKLAVELRQKTPKAFLDILSELGIFSKDHYKDGDIQEKMQHNINVLGQLHSVIASPIDLIQSSEKPYRGPNAYFAEELADFKEGLPHLRNILSKAKPQKLNEKIILINMGQRIKKSEIGHIHQINMDYTDNIAFADLIYQLNEVWIPESQVVITSTEFDYQKYGQYVKEEKVMRSCKKREKIEDDETGLSTPKGIGECSDEVKVAWLLRKLIRKNMPNLSVLNGGVNGLIRSIKKQQYQIETRFPVLSKSKDLEHNTTSASTASTVMSTLENGPTIEEKKGPLKIMIRSSTRGVPSIFD